MNESRTERDGMGTVSVPADALYGAQTLRAVENFPISGWRFTRPLIRALGMIKMHAARVNSELNLLESRLAKPIEEAAKEVMEGVHDEHFPVDVFQTGSGTSTNMNANEVIAGRANELLTGKRGGKVPVHPNDHVNRGQSSNDVIPTAIHIAALEQLIEQTLPSLRRLAEGLAAKAVEFDPIVKIGRTHLMDATPVRLGQEFGGYAVMMEHAVARLEAAGSGLAELALGGTAVGTGLNTHPEFAPRVIRLISEHSGLPFMPASNYFEALGARDAAVHVSAALRTTAVSLTKIANDIRWLASGPRCGLGEITLPALQPGSSIMPGKVNPVLCESVLQVAGRVIGNDATIAWAGAFGGNFELNVMMPVLAHCLLESLTLTARVSSLFAERCVAGIQANEENCTEKVERSLAMCTALATEIGYEEAARIADEAYRTGASVREIARRHPAFSKRQDRLAELLDARRQTS